jgi:hypothetical protein
VTGTRSPSTPSCAPTRTSKSTSPG